MNIYWLEIKRFLEENKKNIIIMILVLGVLLGGIFTFLGQRIAEEEVEEEIEDSKEVFENDSQAAFFRFYIENPDGYAFNNSPVLDELFNMEYLYEEVLLETGTNIKKIKELAEDKEIIDFSPVKVRINSDSYIYTAIFETGNNQANIRLANFYYNYLFNDKISILKDHTVFSLVEPELVKKVEKDDEVKVVSSQKSKSNLVKTIGKNLIISLVLSAIIAIGIVILQTLFGKKLGYVFSYNAEDFDDFMLYDPQLKNKNSIQYFMNTPSSAKRLILSQAAFSQEDKIAMINQVDENITWSSSIETTSTSDYYDEIVLLVQANETTRNWFNKQKKLMGLHEAKTKLIQLNHDFTNKD